MAVSNSTELLTVHERIELFIEDMPVLSNDELASFAEDTCPICLVPFAALNDPNTRGLITKLTECGHAFCRKDLTEWIRGQHGSCPACRHTFLNITPRSESDDESSDGGEYMPPSDDFEDEDDGFLDTDGFTDADAEDEWAEEEAPLREVGGDEDVSPLYDVGVAGPIYEEGVDDNFDMEEEWGLTEGDSGSMSDGCTSFEVYHESDFAPDLVQSLDNDEVHGDIRHLDYSELK